LAAKALQQKPINWLKELDKAARTFEPMMNWDYPLFLLARYPWLRPGFDAHTGTVLGYEKGQQYFQKLVSTWEQRIKKNLPEVLTGLSSDQRQQLAALVIDAITDLEVYKKDSLDKNWYKDLLRCGKRWLRRLDRKAISVRRAAEKWTQEAFTKTSFH
jgi:hypothetical protein